MYAHMYGQTYTSSTLSQHSSAKKKTEESLEVFIISTKTYYVWCYVLFSIIIPHARHIQPTESPC